MFCMFKIIKKYIPPEFQKTTQGVETKDSLNDLRWRKMVLSCSKKFALLAGTTSKK